jgi:hypothetical protein
MEVFFRFVENLYWRNGRMGYAGESLLSALGPQNPGRARLTPRAKKRGEGVFHWWDFTSTTPAQAERFEGEIPSRRHDLARGSSWIK